jgi:two-component system response regulator HydG
LFEAELFAHERGSFTGAERSRPGLFARAQGGTLFLDEVGEVPLSRQAVLLRALESATYRPVGADAERPFDVRFVSATNRDLKHAAAAGQFRSDLLYRLNVLEVRVPPLRERPGDVTLLARDFLARQPGGAQLPISSAALEALESYSWPGNVRELEHDIQRLAAARLQRIELVHLPREIRAAAKSRAPAAKRVRAVAPENERAQVTRALEATGGNITHAAARLGLTRHGLKKKMFRLGIRSPSTAVGPSPQAGNKALRTSFGRAKIRSNQE